MTRQQECTNALEHHSIFLNEVLGKIVNWHALGEDRQQFERMSSDLREQGLIELAEVLDPLPGWESTARSLSKQTSSLALMFLGRDGCKPVWQG